jgi:hypothetical protein
MNEREGEQERDKMSYIGLSLCRRIEVRQERAKGTEKKSEVGDTAGKSVRRKVCVCLLCWEPLTCNK